MPEMLLTNTATDFVKSEAGYLLREDVLAWAKWQAKHSWYLTHWIGDSEINDENVEFHLNKLFFTFPEFRTLFDYRVTKLAPKLRGILIDKLKRRTELQLN